MPAERDAHAPAAEMGGDTLRGQRVTNSVHLGASDQEVSDE